MLSRLQVGSPRNVTVNVLNGNNFFSFDYQSQSQSQQKSNYNPMYQTLSHFLTNQSPPKQKQTNNNIHSNKNRQFNHQNNNQYRISNVANLTNGYVKSAQYSRKMLLQTNMLNRLSLNPYKRIKRVQNLIEQQKSRQSSLQNKDKQKDKNNPQFSTILPNLNMNQYYTQRNNRSEQKQKQIVLKSLTFDPDYSKNNTDNSNSITKVKYSKTINVFSQNYKNRRKLLDKVTHRKGNGGHISPLRWDSKPQDMINHQQRTKHWSPYTGKLINQSKDPFIKTIEGNKIRYAHHQPKYFKGKIQQVTKI